MSEHDKQLIEEAKGLRRWNVLQMDFLINDAESSETKQILFDIKCDLVEMALESL